MRFFNELKKYFKILGIDTNQQNKFNKKNLLALSIFAYTFGAMVAFELFENPTFIDSSKVVHGTMTMVLNSINLLSTVLKQTKLFNLFDKIEAITNKSKWNFIMKIKIKKRTNFVCYENRKIKL